MYKGLYVSQDILGGWVQDYNFRRIANALEALGGESELPASEKAWAWASYAGSSGLNYVGGYYDFFSGNSNFDGGVNFGIANGAYAAHFMVVIGASPVAETTIRVAGTSITDNGVRTAGDSQDIVIPVTASADDYFETPKKWLGQVTVTHISGTLVACNYGWCKYWDNNNSGFNIVGFEATWLGGATDAGADIDLLHHRDAGWTYNAGGEPTPPTSVATMSTDHGTERSVINGDPGAWKRSNLDTDVSGGASEGTIIRITTTQNNTFLIGNFMLRIRSL
jgi:hypothetical protein